MNFLAITEANAKALQAEWIEYVSAVDDLPLTAYEGITNWAVAVSSAAKDRYPDSDFFVLSDDQAPAVKHAGFFEIIHMRKHLSDHYTLKIMSMFVSPHYDFRQEDSEHETLITRRKAVAEIIGELIVHMIDEMFRRKAVQVKIYANSTANIDLLSFVAGNIEDELLERINLDVDRHGNWLVIKGRQV